MIWHSSDKQSVLNFFGTDEKMGLSSQKAESLNIPQNKADGDVKLFFKLLFKELHGYLNIVLAVCSVVSLIVYFAISDINFAAPIIILFLLLLNSAFGAYQKFIVFRKLSKLGSGERCFVTVLRDGTEQIISSDKLVTGDIMLLSEGDYIPADGRIIECLSFRCDEYALTGETVDVEKDADTIAEDISDTKDRKNMVFAGCCVMHGNAKVIVTEINSATQAERMKAAEIRDEKSTSSLTEKLKLIYKYSSFLIAAVCVCVFFLSVVFNVNKQNSNFAVTVINAVMISIALAIAALPESLPSVSEAVKALGIGKLIKSGANPKNINSVERIAGVTVICADKTGVLTKDEMSVSLLFDGYKFTDPESEELSERTKMLLNLAMLCEHPKTSSDGTVSFDQTDIAINDACSRLMGIDKEASENLCPKLGKLPFSSEIRLVTTINMVNGKPLAIVKGAPEALIERCDGVDNKVAERISNDMANKALRVIAVGFKVLDEIPALPDSEIINGGLTFAGYIGLSDPLRDDTVLTVERCEKSGIRTLLLTGDSPATANAIARRAGILHDNMKTVTGVELDAMTDTELDLNITSYAVFARITPAHKYRIIKALKHNNEVVAMTGSSFADAPALRKSDVGISILNDCSDVAFNASDISLKNGSLTSVLNLVNGAKRIFENIKSVIHYLLSCNLGELLAFFAGMIIFNLPIVSIGGLLWIDLVTDSLPALTLGMSNEIPSKRRNLKIFSIDSAIKMMVQALCLCILSIIAFKTGGQTLAFALLGFMQIVHMLSSYSEKPLINSNIFHNRHIGFSALLSTVLMIATVFSPAAKLFSLEPLAAKYIFTLILMTVIFFAIDETTKVVIKLYKKKARQ